MDVERAEMEFLAKFLAAGADMASVPKWLADAVGRIREAKKDCPHFDDEEIATPVYLDVFPFTVRCAKCAAPPSEFCAVCGTPSDRVLLGLHGLLVIGFALCPEHSGEFDGATL